MGKTSSVICAESRLVQTIRTHVKLNKMMSSFYLVQSLSLCRDFSVRHTMKCENQVPYADSDFDNIIDLY